MPKRKRSTGQAQAAAATAAVAVAAQNATPSPAKKARVATAPLTYAQVVAAGTRGAAQALATMPHHPQALPSAPTYLQAASAGLANQGAVRKPYVRNGMSLPRPMTYPELQPEWLDVGRAVGRHVGKSAPTPWAGINYVNQLVSSGLGKDPLSDKWRGYAPNTDEQLPTAAVVSITLGLRESLKAQQKLPPPKAVADELNVEYHAMSSLRAKTNHVGFRWGATHGMRHPSNANVWQARQGLHAYHDRTRSETALKAAQAEVGKPGATPRSILRAAGGAAGAYTLNNMYPPPEGAGLQPENPIGGPKALEMLKEREFGKHNLGVNFGVPMDPGSQQPTDAWGASAPGQMAGQAPAAQQRPVLQRRVSASRLAGQELADVHQRVAKIG